MPKISEMLPSKYLKKEDVGEGVLVTCGKVVKVNVAVEGADPEYKWALHFDEMDKPMILNSTNLQIIGNIHGEDTDGWVGKQIVLYTDHNVSFGGKVIGGIRARAPKQVKDALPF